jgi:hypothetical protein
VSLFRPASAFFVTALVALSITELTACSKEFDDCRSSRTCPPPSAGREIAEHRRRERSGSRRRERRIRGA